MIVTLYYLSPETEGSGASVPSEREFDNTKSMAQFIRRNKVSYYVVVIDAKPCLLLGNKYYPISDLAVQISKIMSRFERCYTR